MVIHAVYQCLLLTSIGIIGGNNKNPMGLQVAVVGQRPQEKG